MLKIESFALGWHPETGGAYRIKPEGRNWGRWVRVPAAELAALAAIFREQSVFIHANGTITTGPQQIGESDDEDLPG